MACGIDGQGEEMWCVGLMNKGGRGVWFGARILETAYQTSITQSTALKKSS